MSLMKKINVSKSTAIISIGVLMSIGIMAWQKIQSFVNDGLQDGKKIRVSETNQCETSKEGKTPRFSGCNSIL